MDEDKEDKNYFKVPNEYKDALCRIRIPGQARQVLDVIERFTWGWKKKGNLSDISRRIQEEKRQKKEEKELSMPETKLHLTTDCRVLGGREPRRQ